MGRVKYIPSHTIIVMVIHVSVCILRTQSDVYFFLRNDMIQKYFGLQARREVGVVNSFLLNYYVHVCITLMK